MKLITVFDVQVWDGADRQNHKFYVSSEESAKDWVKASKFDAYYKKEIVVYDDLTDYHQNNPQALKERTLAKLTPEERKTLGF